MDLIDSIAGKSYCRTEHVSCPLCGSTYEPRNVLVRFGLSAMVAECPPCRIAYQSPRPSRDACIAYMDWRWASSDGYVSDSPTKRSAAAANMDLVASVRRRPGRLLDFGAGSGVFVRAALDAGWDAVGIEQSSVAMKRAKDLYGVDLALDLDNRTFNVITLWDVIEHLREPDALLRRLHEALEPGGAILLSTGNFESWERLARRDKWSLYLFDHHYYFTPASLEKILNRTGFNRFRLLPTKRSKPKFSRVLTNPSRALRELSGFREAKGRWRDHFDISVMAAVAYR